MTHRTIAVRALTAGIGLGAAGWFFAPASSPAQSPVGPAAWLRPATPTLEPTARAADPDTPPFNSYFPTTPSTPTNAATSPWSSTVMPPSISLVPRPGPQTPPPKKDEPTMFGRAWNNVKETFTGSPTPAANGTNTPHAYAVPPKSSQGFLALQPLGATTRPQSNAQGGPNQATPQVYTAPPAYRWYGWGTTTPGQNVYAPDGQSYPNGSARWFVHTGATPGAFPTAGPPAMTRMAGGAEPPGYAGPPSAPLISSFHGLKVSTDPSPRVGPTATVTPPPSVAVVPTTAPPPSPPQAATAIPTSSPPTRSVPTPERNWQESSQVIPTVPTNSAPGTGEMSPRLTQPAADPEPTWQPVRVPPPTVEFPPAPSATVIPMAAAVAVSTKPKPAPFAQKTTNAPLEQPDPGWLPAKNDPPTETKPVVVQALAPPIAAGSPAGMNPVVPAAATLSDEAVLDLERVVREACRSSATVLEIVATKPGKLTVRFVAPSEATAAIAVRVVSQMPQLKPFTVDFEGKVVGK